MLAWQSTTVLFVAPGIWSLVMHGLQFIIAAAGFACLRQIGISDFLGIGTSGLDDRPKLVTTGCHAVVRHPLYLLGILFMLLNPVVTTRWITLTLCSVAYFIFGALLEEHRMIKQYGSIYRSYQQEVPFLLPRLNR
jgi:protein-S-isoprenylcysteine O-methyltransferase Ste14